MIKSHVVHGKNVTRYLLQVSHGYQGHLSRERITGIILEEFMGIYSTKFLQFKPVDYTR